MESIRRLRSCRRPGRRRLRRSHYPKSDNDEERNMSRYDFDDDDRYVVIENHSAGVGPFLVGLAVGAGIALLFAPRSGEATRRDIKRRALRVRRAAEQV